MDRAELRKLLVESVRLLAAPIDFEALVRDGVLEPVGKGYRVLDFNRLPEQARKRMRSMTQRKDGSLIVQFSKAKPTKAMMRLLAEADREAAGE